MTNPILQMLQGEGLLDESEATNIRQAEAARPFSLHWELQTMLWLGVLLLNTGFGILIYENIDTIGHAAIIALIGLLSAGCFWYVWTRRKPFELGPVETPTPYYDYVLLLGCFAFVIMLGYWQYQYRIFGERYGLATLLPTLLFLFLAYRFDHRGVLGLGITGLASWVGISVAPETLLANNEFSSERLIYTGVLFGAFVTGAAMFAAKQGVKRHFTTTYLLFTVHIYCLACLFGLFSLSQTWLFLPLLLLGAFFFFWYARLSQSFFFLTAALVYVYIGVTYWLFAQVLTNLIDTMGGAYFVTFYFLASCAGIIVYLLRYKQLLK